jgi:hypothetical protein
MGPLPGRWRSQTGPTMLTQLHALLTAAPRVFKRAAPVAALLAAGAVSAGAYSGASSHAHHRPGTRSTFTLSATPTRASARPGATVRYAITIHRRHFHPRVRLAFSGRLPAGLRARFLSTRSRATRVTLLVRASTSVTTGRYRLTLRARAGRLTRRLTVTLTIVAPASGSGTASQSPPFGIAGDATTPLEPGVSQPLDLRITNPNSVPLIVDRVDVVVEAVNAPRATSALPCSASDFAVQQFSGSLPVRVPPSSTDSLSGLGIPPAGWPHVGLLDLPTDQDGCQGASVTLGYEAAARLG